MTRRRVPSIAVATALAVLLAGIAVVTANRPTGAPQSDGKAFPGLAAHEADAARIDVVTPSGAYGLAKTGAGWIVPDKAGYPADAQRIAALLATLGDMNLLERKTADPARYDQLNLGDPASGTGAGRVLKIVDATGHVLADATFGKSAPSLGRLGGGMYLRRGGEAQTWLADGLPNIPETADRWMDRDLFGVSDATAIKSATIAADGKTILTVQRAKPEDTDFAARQALPGKPDTAKLDQLGEATVSLTFDDVRAKPADARPARTITFTRFDGTSYVLALYAIGKDSWFGASETGPAAAAFDAAHGKYLFKLPAYRLPVLQGNPTDFVVHNNPDASGAAHPVRQP